jgi:hypothetical protein
MGTLSDFEHSTIAQIVFKTPELSILLKKLPNILKKIRLLDITLDISREFNSDNNSFSCSIKRRHLLLINGKEIIKYNISNIGFSDTQLDADVRAIIRSNSPIFYTEMDYQRTINHLENLINLEFQEHRFRSQTRIYRLIKQFVNTSQFQTYQTTTIRNAATQDIYSVLSAYSHLGDDFIKSSIDTFLIRHTMDM